MLYGELGVKFFSVSDLLYQKMKIRLRLVRARPFHMIIDNSNVSLGIFNCSLYTCFIVLNYNYQKKGVDMLTFTPVDFNFLETLAKIIIIPARQNQLIQENVFNNAPAR